MKLPLLFLSLSILLGGCVSPPHSSTRGTHPRGVAASGGNPLAGVEVIDMAGQRHDLSRVLSSGQNVALVFWQTWCASCLREAPALRVAADENRGQVQFFGVISGEDEYVDEDKVRELVDRFGIPYPQVRDRDLTLTRLFGVQGTPTIVVLNKDGVLSNSHHLPPRWK